MHKLFQSKGISTIINHPIDDIMQYTSEENRDKDYSKRVFEIITQMHDVLVNKKLNLFVYDSSGISRSSTVIFGYLAMYKKVVFWQNLPKIEEHLKNCQNVAFPNLRVIQTMVLEKKEFQAQ